MKIELSDPKKVLQFSIILQNIRVYSDHVVINITNEEMFIQGMDTSHCSFFEIKLNSEWFNIYEYDKNSDISTLGINTNILHKIIGIFREGQNIVLETENEDKLNISFIEENNNKNLNKYFEIPLINIEQELLKINVDDSDVELIMTSKSFNQLINQFQNFDDKLNLHFTEEQVSMYSDGDDGLMKVNVNLDNVIEYSVTEDVNINQIYSLQHIGMMCVFNKLSDEFKMTFSDNKPMSGTYTLDNDSFIKFYLAPRIDEYD